MMVGITVVTTVAFLSQYGDRITGKIFAKNFQHKRELLGIEVVLNDND